MTEFGGGQRADLEKPRIPCVGAWALPSRQWMSCRKALNREMMRTHLVSGACKLVF